MTKRVYDEDKIGYVEYHDGKVSARKKFYGHPQYYYLMILNPETGVEEKVRFENAVYSWRSDDKGNIGEVLR